MKNDCYSYTADDEFQDAGEEEEVLSLCDLPLDEEPILAAASQRLSRSPSTLGPDHARGDQFVFEFMSDHRFEMCAADDIFFRGKLLPVLQEQVSKQQQQMKTVSTEEEFIKRRCLAQRYDGSTSKNRYRPLRMSRSLDDQNLRRFSNPKETPPPLLLRRSRDDRCSDHHSNKNGTSSTAAAAQPRRNLIRMFGVTMFHPPETVLIRDIKSRQARRSLSSSAGGNFPANRSYSNKSSTSSSSCSRPWGFKFIKALSCKDHGSTSVSGVTPSVIRQT